MGPTQTRRRPFHPPAHERARPLWLWLGFVAGLLGVGFGTGCQALPDVQYVTERLEIATNLDTPICQGTLDALDAHVDFVEDGLGVAYDGSPIRVYWLTPDELSNVCANGRGGCFYPATRIVFTTGGSLTHELVHAVLDSEGEIFFIEEGMAELYSGVGVYHDPEEEGTDPVAQLSLTRQEYRSGGLDYRAAGHFMRWIYGEIGPAAVLRLADEVEKGASPGAIETALEQLFDTGVDDVTWRYRVESPRYYAGLSHQHVPYASMTQLRTGTTVALDCASEDTRGPLPDGEAGMYRVLRTNMPEAGIAEIAVQGPPGSFVEVIDPYARLSRGVVQDWTLPRASLDPNAVRIAAGDALELDVKARAYLLVVATADPDGADVTISITPPPSRTRANPLREPPEE